MKNTRKARSNKRRTIRQKGGRDECPYSTPQDQLIRNIWSTTLRILREDIDWDYRGEFHVFRGLRTCNLWVWKQCETRDQISENHLDVYWLDYNNWILGITAKRNGRHHGGQRTFNMRYAENFSHENLCREIANKIDSVYESLLYCAKFDLAWAEAGRRLLNIDGKYIYDFNCTMTYYKSDYRDYKVKASWSQIGPVRYIIDFTFLLRGNVIGSDTLNYSRDDYCNNSFFVDLANRLNRMYNDNYP